MGQFVADALEPESHRVPASARRGRTRHSVTDLDRPFQGASRVRSLGAFSAQCPAVERSRMPECAGYVRQGGGLVVALGQRSDPSSYNSSPSPRPASARPARCQTQRSAALHNVRARSPISLIRSSEKYGKEFDAMLSQVPVYNYWPVTPSAEQTRTLVSFADGAPALMERTFKGARTGHVLLWTTPLARWAVAVVAGRRDRRRLERVSSAREWLGISRADESDRSVHGGQIRRVAQFRGWRQRQSAA